MKANLFIASIVYFIENVTVVLTSFWPWIIANLSIDSIIHFIENLTVVSTIFWPWIIAKLSIDFIVSLLEILTVLSNFFPSIIANLTIDSTGHGLQPNYPYIQSFSY